ncbi:RNA-binding protein Jag [hydrothermal vent metagenome]|uniref:RNA-binding protein Jag n=1 Tax=hydrothermal vent metagenome TaxID=652676 RepID=A0A1W1CE06_9ZZZZ
MKKIEAPTLEEAYEIAARELSCSITELSYEVIQRPSNGLMGMFKKSAIIVAECNRIETKSQDADVVLKSVETIVAEEIIEEVLTSRDREISPQEKRGEDDEPKKRIKNRLNKALIEQDDAVNDSFYTTNSVDTEDQEVVDDETPTIKRPENNNLELAEEIEAKLSELLSYSCLDIDTVEVDVVDDTALIFIDGNDAALLIGKEGYRYNALSYMLFNWLHGKYDLYIKLEVAQFITTQQEMIKNHIKPVIEYVNENGRGKTRPLDGILVQIALEQLRAEFPNKYVAIKTGRDGRKFVIINEFNNKNHA